MFVSGPRASSIKWISNFILLGAGPHKVKVNVWTVRHLQAFPHTPAPQFCWNAVKYQCSSHTVWGSYLCYHPLGPHKESSSKPTCYASGRESLTPTGQYHKYHVDSVPIALVVLSILAFPRVRYLFVHPWWQNLGTAVECLRSVSLDVALNWVKSFEFLVWFKGVVEVYAPQILISLMNESQRY